jgi:negative regulator of sigma-B (phosphoserine phosphatase)
MTVVAWASAGAALAGQAKSGDLAVVVPFPDGALVALIDGLGHGKDACDAALAAEKILLSIPYEPVAELMQRCHEALRGTRGAVISMASFDGSAGTMTWLGVGNVEGLLVRAKAGTSVEAVAQRGGTVGYTLPTLNPRTLVVHPGDTLVMASDGIRHGFKCEIVPSRTPQQIADEVMAHWAKSSDDACVVVARYVGGEGKTKISIDSEEDVAHARIRTRDLARAMGFPDPAADAVATAVSELARNIIDHAVHGEIVLTPLAKGLEVVARDSGPGILDVQQALQDGFTTKQGLGYGLPGARRMVDQLEIASEPGIGTVVRIQKWL